jgi:hypothetical protein
VDDYTSSRTFSLSQSGQEAVEPVSQADRLVVEFLVHVTRMTLGVHLVVDIGEVTQGLEEVLDGLLVTRIGLLGRLSNPGSPSGSARGAPWRPARFTVALIATMNPFYHGARTNTQKTAPERDFQQPSLYTLTEPNECPFQQNFV